MEVNQCDFFTIDTIFGVTKVHKVTKDILTAVRAFDEANEKLYNKLMEVMKENEELKEEVARRGRLINELKSQRKEANELIKAYATPIEVLRKTEGDYIITETKPYCDPIKSQEYLAKWGVK